MAFEPYSGEVLPLGEVQTPGDPAKNISVRHNNPFNIKGNYWGAIGTGNKGFAIYETPEQGWQAGVSQIKLDQSRNMTFGEFAEKYAPAYENPTWKSDVSKMLRVSYDTPIGQIPTERLVNAVAKRESSSVRMPNKNKLVPYTGEIISGPDLEAQGVQPLGQPSAMGGEYKGAMGPAPTPVPEGITGTATPEQQKALKQRTLGAQLTPSPEAQKAVVESLPFAGMAVGGVVGAPAGPAGAVAGAGLGYAMVKKITDAYEAHMGQKPPPGLIESLINSVKDVQTGSMMEMAGAAGGKVLQEGLGMAGKVAKPILGRLSGTGTRFVNEALEAGKDLWSKAQTAFTRAMRGKLNPEETVESAKEAFQFMKDKRSAKYTQQLAEIRLNPDKLNAIREDVHATLKDLQAKDKFDFKTSMDADYKYTTDFSTSPIVEGQAVVKKATEDVLNWPDNTAAGLDILKKRLGKYIDQSPRGTPANSFLTQLKNSLDKGLKREIPGYAAMTKSYGEATTVLDDIEAGLMLRKQGMTGRMTADMTLRRLTSALKDNFALRGDLVDALGEGAGVDLSGALAGHAARSVLPHGLAGSAPALVGEAALAKFVNPRFWLLLVGSSPRIQGEFLRVYGRALQETTGATLPVGKVMAYLTMRRQEEQRIDREPKTYRPGEPDIYAGGKSITAEAVSEK